MKWFGRDLNMESTCNGLIPGKTLINQKRFILKQGFSIRWSIKALKVLPDHASYNVVSLWESQNFPLKKKKRNNFYVNRSLGMIKCMQIFYIYKRQGDIQDHRSAHPVHLHFCCCCSPTCWVFTFRLTDQCNCHFTLNWLTNRYRGCRARGVKYTHVKHWVVR